ncbi:hypothetical protein C7271_01390 [filamentous cyanobacterium CCP5]|nr:hypothetical protein C7271_01390 [filamentous cyanobacterium CCP5]
MVIPTRSSCSPSVNHPRTVTYTAPKSVPYSPSKKLSRYRQLGLIGYGQFGRVYCAVNRQTGSLVALKDISRQRLSTHKFLRELRFLLTLEHPNIATCEALEHSASGRQLVLDYCEGGTLRYLLDAEVPLTLREIVALLLEILAALEHAHSQGIVHCDIKPENILLKIVPGGWQVKLSDLGIARLKQETAADGTGQTGSPAYMAPERFYNKYSAASDLYAVGVIFYELLLGRRPFSGTPIELMVAHLNHYPEVPNNLPEAIRPVIRKSLEKLLARRYQTATEMRADISQLLQVLPANVQAYPLSQFPPSQAAPPLPFVTLPYPVEVLGAINISLPKAEAEDTPNQAKILITCYQDKIWFYHWTGAQQTIEGSAQGFALHAPIQSVLPLSSGGCFFTDHSVHLLTMGQGLTTIARFNNPVTATLSPDARWLAAYWVNAESHHQLILRRLPRRSDGTVTTASLQQIPVSNTLGDLVALTAMDNRHLLITTTQKRETHFQVFTRKGQSIGQLKLGTAIKQLVSTGAPYQFLAVEAEHSHQVLQVVIKPYKVLRYRLDIKAAWLLKTQVGYCVLSRQGELRIINDAGKIIARVNGLPHPTTVLQIGPVDCLLVVSETTHSRVYQLNLENLGLDLIF